MSADLLVGAVAFILTFMTLSYLVADNPAFRVAVHIFVGVAAGYVAAVAWWQVLWPDLLLPLASGPAVRRAALAIPLVLERHALDEGLAAADKDRRASPRASRGSCGGRRHRRRGAGNSYSASIRDDRCL